MLGVYVWCVCLVCMFGVYVWYVCLVVAILVVKSSNKGYIYALN